MARQIEVCVNGISKSYTFDYENGEIEEVFDHESRDGSNWYHVKWVNGDENSWIPEDNFNSMEVINKYFAKGTVNAKKSKKAKNSKNQIY